jgi:hypothetical protein
MLGSSSVVVVIAAHSGHAGSRSPGTVTITDPRTQRAASTAHDIAGTTAWLLRRGSNRHSGVTRRHLSRGPSTRIASMSADRTDMDAALMRIVVPDLRRRGFTGSLPRLRRRQPGHIDLISFQFHSGGGSFVVEVAQCPPTGHTTS